MLHRARLGTGRGSVIPLQNVPLPFERGYDSNASFSRTIRKQSCVIVKHVRL